MSLFDTTNVLSPATDRNRYSISDQMTTSRFEDAIWRLDYGFYFNFAESRTRTHGSLFLIIQIDVVAHTMHQGLLYLRLLLSGSITLHVKLLNVPISVH